MPVLRQLSLRWKIILGIVVAYSVAHFAYSGVYYAMQMPGGDFLAVFPGPLMFRATEVWPWLAKDWIVSTKGQWFYGPVLHGVTLPFVLTASEAQAMRIILAIDYGLLAMIFYLWVRLLCGNRPGAVVCLGMACIWLNYLPLLEVVTGREIELLELWLITVGIWALRRQREGLAGTVFGLAAMTKFLPLIFLPYLFVKGFRKAFWMALGTVLVIAGLTQWLLGFEHSDTFSIFGGEIQGSMLSASYANQALRNVLYKMFSIYRPYQPHPDVVLYLPVLRWIGIALHVGVACACGWFLWRWRRSRLLEIECALLAIVMVLIAPHAHTYYLVFALPALSVGVAYWIRSPQALSPMLKGALSAAIVLSGFLIPMKILEIVTGVPGKLVARVLQTWSLPAFGAVFATLVMIGIHQKARVERLAVVDVEPQ